MTLRVSRIDGAERFAGLAPAWADLSVASGQTSPFLSHDWFSCCWIAVAPGRRPETLVMEEASGPVALVPLVRWTARALGAPIRCIGFLDCPDTPFVDMVAVSDPAAVVESLLEHLAGRSDWDVAHFHKLPATSATLKALEDLLPGRFRWRRAGTMLSPYLAIEGGWKAFYASRSQRFKKTIRNTQNRLERAGRVNVEEHRTLDPSGPLFAAVMDLTRRSRKAERGISIATMPRMGNFFAELTRRATARDWLSLWLLTLDDTPIAMEYQLRSGGNVHALRADFDATHGELSPGSALNFAIARALFETEGVRKYDMGPGLNEYKLRWASGADETVAVRIYRAAPYARLLHLFETVVVPAARRIRERFR